MIFVDSICLGKNQKELFSNLTFRVSPNQKRLIQGKSGVGKTTLLKLILGFETPDSGKILVNKIRVAHHHIRAIRSQIFYLSQDIDLRKDIISRFLDEVLTLNNQRIKEDQLNEWLAFLELNANVLDKESSSLSGGERQRIGLLLGFLLDRPIWLLDEPTSALDKEMKSKIVTKLWTMEKTMLIISHDEIWPDNNTIIINKG